MAENRVHSKHLFNFHPTGVVDQDIVEKENEMMKEFNIDEEAMVAQMLAMTDEEYAVDLNGMMEGVCASLFNAPEYLEVWILCLGTLSICVHSFRLRSPVTILPWG